MYLEVLKQEERFRFCFCGLSNTEKETNNSLSSKLKSKLCLEYLEVKLDEVRFD